MKIVYSLILILIVLSNSLGSAQPVAYLPKEDNQFAVDLYSRLSSNKGNIFFSPYSLSCALTMAFEGARGKTAQEMSQVLHLNADAALRRMATKAFIQQINRTDKLYEISIANALWAQKAYPLKDDYLDLIKNNYFAQAVNLDFVSSPEASRGIINSWVSDHTLDRINDLLPPGSVTPHTRMILTDAVYFKGQWETPFKKMNTIVDSFWLAPGQSVQTEMMVIPEGSFYYIDNDQVQALKLPYQENELSMLIILPHAKDTQGLEKNLTLELLEQWQKGMISQKVNVFLPKFKFDTSYQMSDVLTGMGMKLAFDQKYADFTGMANEASNENLYISKVFHKAWIDTDEEGTEAAAATAVVVEAAMARRIEIPTADFRADHPFIFVIQDNKTGRILFMGRVSEPREK